MKIVAKGDLARLGALNISTSIDDFIEKAKKASSPQSTSVGVLVGNKTIVATATLDPKTDTLEVKGYF